MKRFQSWLRTATASACLLAVGVIVAAPAIPATTTSLLAERLSVQETQADDEQGDLVKNCPGWRGRLICFIVDDIIGDILDWVIENWPDCILGETGMMYSCDGGETWEFVIMS